MSSPTLDSARRTKTIVVRSLRRARKRLKRRLRRIRKDLARIALHKRIAHACRRVVYRTTLALVPSRDDLPDLLNARTLTGTGIEIGVRVGRYSEHLLDQWQGKRLISVDPWIEAPADEYVDHSNVPQQLQEEYYQRTRTRLARHGDRSEIWRMTSPEAAARIPDRSLDFVYVDARHDYESVLEDLHLWFPKLRPGGILAGHDYFDGKYKGAIFGVRRAVDEFFATRRIRVHQTRERPPRFRSWLVEIPRATRARDRGYSRAP